jgi:hypothetical protein
MFEIFGEFDSAEEINQAAAGMLAEGKNDDIKKLVKENGLDPEFAEAYIARDIPVLTDPMMAAVGKIELERPGINDPIYNGIKEDIFRFILATCQDEAFARGVRKKGKSLKNCIEHCKTGTKKLVGAQGGSVTDRVVYGFVKEYYLGGTN